MNQLTLGSLFDGIGGFPLAGIKSGIRPVWASEIEPFPVRVTEKRLPDMKHYGDVSKLNGGDLEPVDIITFGSPCQDLSIAGKRSGLDGARSGLFREAIRIITEMRCKTNGRSPRWAVWENVPGALSSANGHDFREVLESLIRIKDPKADVPMPDEGGRHAVSTSSEDTAVPQECTQRAEQRDGRHGKWLPAGEILGDNYSLAWRILDASKGWGVAQRRKRIFAVLDLDGQCAGEVLFESEGLSGYTPPRCEAGEGAARGAEEGTGETSLCLNDQGGNRMDVTYDMTSTLRAEAHHPPCIMGASGFCTEHSADSRSIGYREEESPTLRAGVTPGVAIEYNSSDSRIKFKEDGSGQMLCSETGTGGTNIPLVFGISADKSNAMLSDNPHSGVYEAQTSRTLDCNGGSSACNQGGMMVVTPMLASGKDQCGTLTARASGEKAFLGNQEAFSGDYYVIEPRQDAEGDAAYCIQGSMIGRKDENGPQGDGINQEVSFTLNTIDRHAVYAMSTGHLAQAGEDASPTMPARDYKDPPIAGAQAHSQPSFSGQDTLSDEPTYSLDRASFNAGANAQYQISIAENEAQTLLAKGPGAVASPTANYIVRRLTPGECCRLQGFPDGWCENLGTSEPTEEEINRWADIFEEHRLATAAHTKPKTINQITKWLIDPHSDSAEYKAYGNSVAVPCVFFVLAGIVWAQSKEVRT